MEIPGFELIEKLGEGGMASVWKARQISLNRIVAIKILSERLAREQSDTERFVSEAQSMAALKHPGIIQVYDANIADGLYYFVMEFVAGYSVGDWIRRKGAIPESEALIAVHCVAEALNYAWNTQGIIHCDIKPDNVMIDSDGTIKVADMGLARSIAARFSPESDDEVVMGTPNYMSPEQIMGEPDLDCRSDIYSLGAMLYHMITNEMPFHGNDGETVLQKHLAAQLPDPIEVNPKVSLSVCWLIEKMMARDRKDRYQDWNSAISDLVKVHNGALLVGSPLTEGTSTVARSARRSAPAATRARRVVVDGSGTADKKKFPFLAIIVGLSLVIAAAAAWLVLARGKQPAPPPDPVKKQVPVAVAPANATPAVTAGQPKPQTIPRPVMTEELAKQMYEDALRRLEEQPDQLDESIQRFLQIAMDTRGTSYMQLSSNKADELKALREEKIREIMITLKRDSGFLEDESKYNEAIGIFSNYKGSYADITKDERRKEIKRIEDLVRKKTEKPSAPQDNADGEDQKPDKRSYGEFLNRLTGDITSGDLDSVRQRANQARERPAMKEHEDGLRSIVDLMDGMRQVDENILESFAGQKDQTITVILKSGSRTFKVTGADNGKITGEERINKGAYQTVGPIELKLSDLSAREVLKRLGTDENQAVILKKGLLALETGSYAYADKYFSRLDSPISQTLRDKTAEIRAAKLKEGRPEEASDGN